MKGNAQSVTPYSGIVFANDRVAAGEVIFACGTCGSGSDGRFW